MDGDSPQRPWRVVLGYDRTESARAAAIWAAARLPLGGRLVIVHASRPLHALPSPLTGPAERRALGRALIAELLLEGPDFLLELDIEAEVSDQDPVSALIDAAERHEATEIVIGHEQHSTVHRALGTVTDTLLDRSPVPVIVVPLTATRELHLTGSR